MIKVRNMKSSRGNTVANQFIIEGDNWEIFQSYNSVIAKKIYDGSGTVYLDEHYWDYSRTTGTYRNSFLGENKNLTQLKINSGKYILTNLNK
tara:strand:+ start:1658 stop:1933 length:276 start_codon:yes stop_codon:yes gene_type:complete